MNHFVLFVHLCASHTYYLFNNYASPVVLSAQRHFVDTICNKLHLMLISYALSNFSECMTSFLEVLGMKRHIGSQLSPLFTYLLHIYSVLLSICTMSTLLLLSSSFKLTHHVLFSVIHVCKSYIILFVHFCVRNVQRHFLKCFSQKRHFRSQRFGMHHIFFVWRYV